MEIGVAILGAGRIGKVHAETISSMKNARLIAVAEPIEEIADSIKQQYNCKILSVEEIAFTKEIDAVVKCLNESTQMGKYSREFEDKIAKLFNKKSLLIHALKQKICFLKKKRLGMKKTPYIIECKCMHCQQKLDQINNSRLFWAKLILREKLS